MFPTKPARPSRLMWRPHEFPHWPVLLQCRHVLRRMAHGPAHQEPGGDAMRLIAILIAAAFLLPAVARAECLSSARAVRAEHGISAWSTWRNIEGRKCWFEGERHDRNNQSLLAVASL